MPAWPNAIASGQVCVFPPMCFQQSIQNTRILVKWGTFQWLSFSPRVKSKEFLTRVTSSTRSLHPRSSFSHAKHLGFCALCLWGFFLGVTHTRLMANFYSPLESPRRGALLWPSFMRPPCPYDSTLSVSFPWSIFLRRTYYCCSGRS